MGRLANKIAFITGTGTGQGRAAALLFAAEGATVVGCDLKEAEALETLKMVHVAGGEMISLSPVDLGSSEDAAAWLSDGISRVGGMDILYNNAGAVRFEFINKLSAVDWAFTIRNELDLIFHVSQAAWPHLVARGGGVIINTASVSGLTGNSAIGATAHAAAKGGIIAMTRQMAAEGAVHGIRVNTISPGPITTPASAVLDEATVERLAERIPLKRWGQPEDVAYCALYLASDEARWVTAANFVVDGGVSAIHA